MNNNQSKKPDTQHRKNPSGAGNVQRQNGTANSSRGQQRVNNPQNPQYRRPAVQNGRNNNQGTVTINTKTIIIALVFILVILTIIAFSAITQRSIPERETPSQVEEQSKIELKEEIVSPFEVAQITSSDYIRGTLALINSDYPYNFDYVGADIKEDEIVRVNQHIENRTFKASDNTIYLARETIGALNLMFADFYAQTGKNDVMVHSAHRTYEQQKSILDKKIQQLGENQQIAQTPGNSEHHSGYGFDIMIYPDGGVGAGTFTGEGVYSWIYENCHKYGFILRYPEGKTEITGVAPESWHFRYVGVPHATYIYQNNITLEEYISEIKSYTENVPLTIEVSDAESYDVYYVKKSGSLFTEFNVPKDTEYKISGDNVGGFVVWYKKAELSDAAASE